MMRDGYVDSAGGDIGFIDALYYASVTVTTTGYGDISAVSTSARLSTIILITPVRIVFLILVVGTTVEVLTDQTRHYLSARRWRNKVTNHIVVCGFGSTGQSAVRELLARDIDPSEIVIVDVNDEAIDQALARGFVAVQGDATQNAILEQANITEARAVVVAPNRDDTAVLITLTVREHNTQAHIVAGGREQENLHLLRQGGADEVIDATAAVGRMLGLATTTPGAVTVLDDLLDNSHGLQLREALVEASGVRPSTPAGSSVIAVIRDGRPIAPSDDTALRSGDRLIFMCDGESN